MKSQIKKVIFVIVLWLLFIAYFIYTILSLVEDSNEILPNVFGIIGTLFFVSQYTYENFQTVYSTLNKAKVWLANPTVYWSMESKFYSKDFTYRTLEEIYDELFEKFNDKNVKNINGFTNKLELLLTIENRNISVFVEKNNDEYIYNIQFYCEASYRSSIRNLYTIFDQIINLIKSCIVKPKNEHYSLIIRFQEYNPFYKIYIKSLSSSTNLDFSMNYEEESSKFRVSNNQIEILAKSIKEIRRYGKKYIAISTKNLFQ